MSYFKSAAALEMINKILRGLESLNEVKQSDNLKEKVSNLNILFNELRIDVEDMRFQYNKLSVRVAQYEKNPYEK